MWNNAYFRERTDRHPERKKCRENHGLGAVIPREDISFVRSKFLSDKREEYKDDEELSKFLSSDKSDEYKYLIIKHLEEDLSGLNRKDYEIEARRCAVYRERNKQAINQRQAEYCELIRKEKRYYCKLCDKAFAQRFHLQKHFESKKHLRKVTNKNALQIAY